MQQGGCSTSIGWPPYLDIEAGAARAIYIEARFPRLAPGECNRLVDLARLYITMCLHESQ